MEVYSSLKILRETLEMELDSRSVLSKRNSMKRLSELRSCKSKHTIAKVTNAYSLEFMVYIKELIDRAVSKIVRSQSLYNNTNHYQESSHSKISLSSNSTKLCYKKLDGKYILSPTSANSNNSGSLLGSPSAINFGRANAMMHLKDDLMQCRGFVDTLVIAGERMSLGPPPDLRKVVSEHNLKGKYY